MLMINHGVSKCYYVLCKERASLPVDGAGHQSPVRGEARVCAHGMRCCTAAAVREQLGLYVLKDSGIVAQCWRDGFLVFQKFNGPYQQLTKDVFGDHGSQLGVRRIEGGGEDEDVAKLPTRKSQQLLPMTRHSTYACAVPRILVIISRAGTWSNAVVLLIAA